MRNSINKIKTKILLYLLFRDTPLLSRVPTCQSSPSSTELDKCTYFKSFCWHQQLVSPSLNRLHGTVRISLFDYSPTGEKKEETKKETVPLVFFAQTALRNSPFSSQDCFTSNPLIKPNAPVACIFFRSSYF